MERAVVVTGLGGQGVQLLARVLAHAAMREGRRVMAFGMFKGTIRGGSSESTVVVADDEIVAPPIVPSVWGIVALHGEGLPKLAAKVEPGGVLLRNASLVPEPPWPRVHAIALPVTALAEAMGQVMGAGMIALGGFAAATGLVGLASLEAALGEVLPPHRRQLVDTNRRCLARGADAVAALGEAGAVPAWTG
jgi:Pyruvate/2-oxoacid:ferredoxin oxidoreductase gamma subunit